MPATQADLDHLDAILDRLDDYTGSHLSDPAIERIATDMTEWYRRMFRPHVAPLLCGVPARVATLEDWGDIGCLVRCIRRVARRMVARPSPDRMASTLLVLAADASVIVAAVESPELPPPLAD